MIKDHFYLLEIADNEMLIEATGEKSGNILAIRTYFKHRDPYVYNHESVLPPTASFTMTLSGPPIWDASFTKCRHPITNEIPKENLPLFMGYRIIFSRFTECLKEL